MSSARQKRTLLATAIVNVLNSTGNQIAVRALIDGGSEDALIKESLAEKLGLFLKPELAPIVGVGGVVVQPKTNLVKVQFKSHTDPTFNMEVEAFTMKTVTGNLPSIPVEREYWPHLQGIRLADHHFDRSSPIEMLLGMEVFEAIIMDGLIPKVNDSPTAMNSRLGWLLFGKVHTKQTIPRQINCMHASRSEETLETALRSFWELEEVPALRKPTVKEQQAEDLFKKKCFKKQRWEICCSSTFRPQQGISKIRRITYSSTTLLV